MILAGSESMNFIDIVTKVNKHSIKPLAIAPRTIICVLKLKICATNLSAQYINPRHRKHKYREPLN